MKICRMCKYHRHNKLFDRHECLYMPEDYKSMIDPVTGKIGGGHRICAIVNKDGNCKHYEDKTYFSLRKLFS